MNLTQPASLTGAAGPSLFQSDQSGQLTQVLQGGMSVVAGRRAVAAFDVGAMPDTHVVSRH